MYNEKQSTQYNNFNYLHLKLVFVRTAKPPKIRTYVLYMFAKLWMSAPPPHTELNLTLKIHFGMSALKIMYKV